LEFVTWPERSTVNIIINDENDEAERTWTKVRTGTASEVAGN
jgi:hypothetical protein